LHVIHSDDAHEIGEFLIRSDEAPISGPVSEIARRHQFARPKGPALQWNDENAGHWASPNLDAS
jgi:hypothetical protein